MKPNSPFIVCQITDTCIKLIKCRVRASKAEITDAAVEKISSPQDDKTLSSQLQHALKELKCTKMPVIISMPRAQTTCRFIKVPSGTPDELDKIARLQAARFLPYPANELIVGYQTISIDKQNIASINLVIVQTSIVERYLRIFHLAHLPETAVFMSCVFFGFYPARKAALLNPVEALRFE